MKKTIILALLALCSCSEPSSMSDPCKCAANFKSCKQVKNLEECKAEKDLCNRGCAQAVNQEKDNQ